MEAKPAEVFLGDLTRALGSSGDASARALAATAAFLGLPVGSPEVAVAVTTTPATLERSSSDSALVDEEGRDGGPTVDAPLVGSTMSAPVPSRRDVAPGGTRPSLPEFLAGAHALPAPSDEAPVMPPAPLFVPRWERAIVSAAVAVPEQSGPVDVREVVRRLARAEAITLLPRQRRPSLRAGAHVLVDVGRGMLPFTADRVQLLKALRRVVGADRTPMARFVGTPSRGCGGSRRDRWKPFEPAPGRPVVLATDLGIARTSDAASQDEWLVFLRRMQAAGCRVTAFIPYPPVRVPSPLARFVTIVFWDRATSPGQVARIARRAVR